MYEEKPKGFIEELQSLDDGKKRRVLIIATVVLMLVIVTVWLSYFNGILAGGVSANSATSSIAIAPANGPSLWQNIENGFASIGSIFKGHSDYKIAPQSN